MARRNQNVKVCSMLRGIRNVAYMWTHGKKENSNNLGSRELTKGADNGNHRYTEGEAQVG